VAERVERDFRSAIRAGVTTTPTIFVEGERHAGAAVAAYAAAVRDSPQQRR
jgi:protein-disulfide isomerase